MKGRVSPLIAASAPNRFRSIPAAVWFIAAVAVILRIVVSVATQFTSEDFLITLRYVDNIAAGHGFVYNLGERVLGTTTPLYTLLLAFISKVGLPTVATSKAINIAADGALVLAVWRWLDAMGQPVAGRVAAILIAVNPVSLRWSISGMETSLVTLAGVLALTAFTLRKCGVMFALLGVLFLLRWDSLLLTGVLTAAVIWRERRIPVRGLVLWLLIVLPWIVFAWAYFGNPIPITGAAKMAVYGWRSRGTFLPQAGKLAWRLWGSPVHAAMFVLSLLGLYRCWRLRLGMMVPPLIWFALYWSAFLYSKNLLFEWYLAPTMPVYAALFGLGVAVFTPVAAKSNRVIRHGVGWVALAATAIYVGAVMIRTDRDNQLIEENLRIPLGLWLRDHSAPGERIMLEPIGYIGYYSQRPIIDSIGLISPQVIPFWNEKSGWPMLDIALALRPEWVVLRPAELVHVQDAARPTGSPWESSYRLVRTFSYTPRVGRDMITFHAFRRIDMPPLNAVGIPSYN